jgi:hypothetical protein
MAARPRLITNPRLRKKFSGIVRELWRKRAAKLFAYIERNPGPRLRLRRRWRDRQAGLLADVVLDAYMPYLRRWVARNTTRLLVRLSRRTARDEKARVVTERIIKRGWGHHKNIVYATFAGRQECLKVGRSNVGLRRLLSQRRDVSFWLARRAALFFPKRRKRSTLPALECALTHLYDPKYSEVWPPQNKYLQKCPACRDTLGLYRIVDELFPA